MKYNVTIYFREEQIAKLEGIDLGAAMAYLRGIMHSDQHRWEIVGGQRWM